MNERKEAILFDLDGTLWNSSREVLLCWNRVLAPLGRHISPEEMDTLSFPTCPPRRDTPSRTGAWPLRTPISMHGVPGSIPRYGRPCGS